MSKTSASAKPNKPKGYNFSDTSMKQHMRNALLGRMGMAKASVNAVANDPMSTPEQIALAQDIYGQLMSLDASIRTEKLCLETGEIIPAKTA